MCHFLMLFPDQLMVSLTQFFLLYLRTGWSPPVYSVSYKIQISDRPQGTSTNTQLAQLYQTVPDTIFFILKLTICLQLTLL